MPSATAFRCYHQFTQIFIALGYSNIWPEMSKRAETSQQKDQTTSPVDERLQRISRDILPSTPYILSVPSGGYRGYPHQANDWRRSCPFGSNEERLQYLTFRSQFDKDTIFNAHPNWDDGEGNIMSKTDKPSGLNTPLPGQPPKKKITLSDYKNKAAGNVSVKVAPAKTTVEVKASQKGSHPGLLSSPASKSQQMNHPHGVKRYKKAR